MHPATRRSTLPLQRGEGRWLHAGNGLQLLVQRGSVTCQGAPQWPEARLPAQRLADGDTLPLTGWVWLQAERSSLLLCLQPERPARRWRQAARALLQALIRPTHTKPC